MKNKLDIYSIEFIKYLEPIVFDMEKNTIERSDVINFGIGIYKNQHGRFSSVMAMYEVVDSNGLCIDIGNYGIDIKEDEINKYFSEFLLKNRDRKIKKILE